MSNEVKRNFKGSDAEMLTAISTITQAAIENQAALAAKRASWADPFFTNLKTEIDDVTKTYLGADSVKDLRKATQTIEAIQATALGNLEEIKVQVERDFRQDKTTRDELLNELGYAAFFKAAAKKDQNALVQLLFRFKQGLTPDVQAQLTEKGIDAGTLTTLIGFADVLNNANVTQETFKSNRKISTQAAVNALNDVYGKAMDVAIIAAKLFKGDAAKQARFSYSRAMKAQQGGPKATGKTPAPPVVNAAT